jgi:hypothetical protein
MPWNNGSLTVYHGTVGPYARDILANGVTLARCAPKTDFSTGFYTTRILEQAVRFANHRYQELHDDYLRLGGFNPESAVVAEFSVQFDGLGGLDTLAFVQPTPDWLDFVNHCRMPSYGHKGYANFYDAVYGPVSGTIGLALPDEEQLSFHSVYAISLLTIQNADRRGTPTL